MQQQGFSESVAGTFRARGVAGTHAAELVHPLLTVLERQISAALGRARLDRGMSDDVFLPTTVQSAGQLAANQRKGQVLTGNW